MTLFVWGAVSHMLLPWTEQFLLPFNNEAAVVAIAGDLPEWNWYDFGAGYTAVEFFDTL